MRVLCFVIACLGRTDAPAAAKTSLVVCARTIPCDKQALMRQLGCAGRAGTGRPHSDLMRPVRRPCSRPLHVPMIRASTVRVLRQGSPTQFAPVRNILPRSGADGRRAARKFS